MTINKICNSWDKLNVVLDLHTVAQIYGVNDDTIKRWCRSGILKATKINKCWFFDRDYIKGTVTAEKEK